MLCVTGILKLLECAQSLVVCRNGIPSSVPGGKGPRLLRCASSAPSGVSAVVAVLLSLTRSQTGLAYIL